MPDFSWMPDEKMRFQKLFEMPDFVLSGIRICQLATMAARPVTFKFQIEVYKKFSTLGGTRTPNPRFRRPMPYPLGHEGFRRLLLRFPSI